MKWAQDVAQLVNIADALSKQADRESPYGPIPPELCADLAKALLIIAGKLELDDVPEATQYSDVNNGRVSDA